MQLDRRLPGRLTKEEIRRQIQELHAEFKVLSDKLIAAQDDQQARIRLEMEPIVARENSLQAEHANRALLGQTAAQQQMGFGY